MVTDKHDKALYYCHHFRLANLYQTLANSKDHGNVMQISIQHSYKTSNTLAICNILTSHK